MPYEETNGKIAWEAYRKSVGGLSFTGQPLPDWEDLGDRQREGWEVGAEAVASKTRQEST